MHRRISGRLGLGSAAALLLSLVGCGDEPSGKTEGSVTYQRDVRPIIERSCTTCHNEGGPTPYDFTAPVGTSTPEWASAAVAAVSAGRMPPWMPADDCRDLMNVRTLTEDERAIFRAWSDEGFALGDEADFEPLPSSAGPDAPSAPDLEITPVEPYAPSPESGSVDDYRCFLLPYEFDQETYVVGSSVSPGQLALSHHALIYLIQPSALGAVEALEDEDEVSGYSCFGGPGGGALTTIGGWVPGATTAISTDGSAMVIPAGSRLVLQMHYNTLAFGVGASLPDDQSTVKLWTTPEQPAYRLESLPLAHLSMEIEPFESESRQQRVYTAPTDATIVAVTPHMHLLGTSIEVSVERAAGPECLVDIPAWDFHWQQQYTFTEALDVKKGDRITVECTYDNSLANQPDVNGSQKMPETVRWGEGTLDEMCLSYAVFKVPFDAPDFRCGSYPACQATCAEGDGRCFFECTTVGGGQCAPCMLSAVFQCAPSFCASDGLALKACASDCADVSSSCLLYDCAAEFDAFYACMEPHLEAGECNTQTEACAVEL